MIFGIIANLQKPDVKELVPEVIRWLQQKGLSFWVEQELASNLNLKKVNVTPAEELCERCSMVLSFGGDGTILSSARLVGKAGIPILGVKIGGMGFLAEVTPEDLFTNLEAILQGDYRIVERMALEARLLKKDSHNFFALNDIVLDKGAVSRVIRIRTFIDEDFLNTYIGDGLIISSPTGSTAYSLAAGGPILLPTMDALIISPICPHTLGARPVVIPGDKVVRTRVEYGPQKVMFSADGQIRKELQEGDEVEIRRAPYRIKLVSRPDRSFYDVLRAKLHWGEDIRDF